MRHFALLIVLSLLALAGCGGGDHPSSNTTGGVTGRINSPTAASFNLEVDGQELQVTPGADGSFTIPNLPPGDHSLTVIGGDSGYVGAHVGFTILPGDVIDIGPIDPTTGGQIAGMVTKMDGNSNLTPVAGVEVIADAEPIYVMDGSDGSTMPPPPPRDGEMIQFRAITDETGGYRIPAVPAGAYAVTVNVPGLVQGVTWVYVSPGTTSTADFQLQEAIEAGVGTVQGTIIGIGADQAEAPLEGATVTITVDGTAWRPQPPTDPIALPIEALSKALAPKQASGMMPPIYDFQQFTTLTDSAGHYSLNVPSGYLSISAWAEYYSGAYESFALRPREVLTKDYKMEYWNEVPPPDVTPLAKKKQ